MPFTVLIAPDKFKGTLTAVAAARAIARGWRAARPNDALDLLPISDGGDGFGAALSAMLHAKPITIKTVDAAQQPRRACWWWEPKSKTAIIESANVIGLALLPVGKFHPFALDTFGLGAVIRAAAKKGARRCFIGIGGSATNDAGFGVARALGWEFLDAADTPITAWTGLHKLAKLRRPEKKNWPKEIIVAVDVQNPLLGARGCTRIYGPQKGLSPNDFPAAERYLRRLALVAKREMKRDFAREPGAGAAGGLGFGLRCFLGARLQPGFDLMAKQTRLDQHLRAADLVVTGEGAIDASSLMGKGVGELARRCLRAGIPCIGLGGSVVMSRGNAQKYFARLHGLTELTDKKDARERAAFWLEQLSRAVAGEFQA